MRWFVSRLYLERRRLAIIASFSFVGGWLAFWGDPAELLGFPMPLVAGIAFVVGVTAFCGVLIFLFPAIRHQTEATASALPLLSLSGAFAPDAGNLSIAFTSILGLTVIYLAATLYGTNWLDRFVPRRNAVFRSRARTRLSPEELWPYVSVTPDSPPELRSPETALIEWVEPGKTFREVARMGEIAKIEEIGTIQVMDAPNRYRFAFEVPDAANVHGCRGVYDRRLARIAGGTILETTRELDLASWRATIHIWVDDSYARLDAESMRSYEAKVAARRAQ
jgi:hypothetical protein